jgi:trk system potassium uptake protein TrkH
MTDVGHPISRYPATTLFVWFLGLIAVGTVLLLLPICRASDAQPISLSDAAFTATSASCVTGLSVRSTAYDFSFCGQCVILLLIQLGGIGIFTIATLFYIRMTGRSKPEAHLVVEETLGAFPKDDLMKVLRGVVGVTLLIEGTGAVILIVRRLFLDTPLDAIWWGLFHSISSFCNAGFALQDDSLSQSVSDPVVNLTIIALFLIGGIGYPVLRDVWHVPNHPRGSRWQRLTFHTKLTLAASVFLVVVGVIFFWVLERNNTLAGLSTGETFWATCFQATTTRTAGFNTLPIGELTNATLLGMILFMAIGGNSCSTAGGMKVSTVSVLVLNTIARFRGKREATLFGRRISKATVSQAAIVILVYMLIAGVGLILVVNFEEGRVPHSQSGGIFLDAFFEVVSALATVGLSTGFTAQLSEPSRGVIIFLMFAGRVGPLAIVTVLSRPMRDGEVNLPEAHPLIG